MLKTKCVGDNNKILCAVQHGFFFFDFFFEIISYQNYIICRIAIFGMIYFQRTVAKWYFAEWHISKHFFAESRLRNIWLPNNLFPIFQFPNIFCRIVLPYGSVAECLFCRMVFCRMCFLRNIVAEWPTLYPINSLTKAQLLIFVLIESMNL